MSTSSDELLLKNNPKLSAEDIKTYRIKTKQLFKTTIAICAIYGSITFVILLLAMFSAKANQIFTEDIRPFTYTFIGGMIFVIVLLIIQISTFKPVALTVSSYDADICPDYWKLVPTAANEPIMTNTAADDQTRGLLKYKCVPDQTLFNTYRNVSGNMNPYGQTIATSGNTKYTLKNIGTTADPATNALFSSSKCASTECCQYNFI
jgi:hypothetical protein